MSIKHCMGQIHIPTDWPRVLTWRGVMLPPRKNVWHQGSYAGVLSNAPRWCGTVHQLSSCSQIWRVDVYLWPTACNITQWVPVWGASASLTMMELHAVNDLSNMEPSPYQGFEPVRWPSPEVVKGILAGAESNTDSVGVEDSREWMGWESVSIWSCCPSPPTKVGPTWA